MDRWLTALKVAHEAPASTKPVLNVEPQFRDLCVTDNDDASVVLTGQVFDGDVPAADVPSPTDSFLKALLNERNRIPEFAPPHADGVEIERYGDVVWKFHWKAGQITKTDVWDPDYRCIEKRDLDEAGRHTATARFASVRPDLDLIDAAWEELLGGHAGAKEIADSKKKVASNELAKGDVASKMFSALANVKGECVGTEYSQLEKAARALDVAAFTEILEAITARMKTNNERLREGNQRLREQVSRSR